MTAPEWLTSLLGWKNASSKSRTVCTQLFGSGIAPNLADLGNRGSLHISGEIYRQLGIPKDRARATPAEDSSRSNAGTSGQEQGANLEREVSEDLRQLLDKNHSSHSWNVSRNARISTFEQFSHIGELQTILENNPALRSTYAGDYQVKTDVCVGLIHDHDPESRNFLHAAVSCKWTIRSDRVQNVRHEFGTLVKSRRGRLPHLVLVTAEPLPSRLISIARGTGELDAVYHLMFDELNNAVEESGLSDQQEHWNELTAQRRVLPYRELINDLLLS